MREERNTNTCNFVRVSSGRNDANYKRLSFEKSGTEEMLVLVARLITAVGHKEV